MTYLFCSILGGAVLGAICLPLFRRDNSLESAIIEETQWDLLQRKKEVILGNMQDLDFEYKCGKLSDRGLPANSRGHDVRSGRGSAGNREHRID